MAAGKPVIGVAEGGLLETVVPGQTGVLVAPAPTPGAVMDAVTQIEQIHGEDLSAQCRLRAQQFTEAAFIARMQAILR